MIVARGGGSHRRAVGVQRGARRARDLRAAACPSSRPSATRPTRQSPTTSPTAARRRRPPPPRSSRRTASRCTVRLGIAAGHHGVDRAAEHRARAREPALRARAAMERRLPDVYRERQRIDDLARRSLAGRRDGASRRGAAASAAASGGCVRSTRSRRSSAATPSCKRGAEVVSSVDDVKSGDALDVRVKDGTLRRAVVGGAAPGPRRVR